MSPETQLPPQWPHLCPYSGPQLPDSRLRDGPEHRALPGQWGLWLRAETPIPAQPPQWQPPPPRVAHQGENPLLLPPASHMGDTNPIPSYVPPATPSQCPFPRGPRGATLSPHCPQVITAQQLPKLNREKLSSIVDPFVRVEIYGVTADCSKQQTAYRSNNGDPIMVPIPPSASQPQPFMVHIPPSTPQPGPTMVPISLIYPSLVPPFPPVYPSVVPFHLVHLNWSHYDPHSSQYFSTWPQYGPHSSPYISTCSHYTPFPGQ